MPLTAETSEKIRLLLLFNKRIQRELKLLEQPLTDAQAKLVKSAIFSDYLDFARLTSVERAQDMLEGLRKRA